MSSVLLVRDQEQCRFPDRCVFTGDKTETAAHVWATELTHGAWLVGLLGFVGVLAVRVVGNKTMRVALPVTEERWGIWTRRTNACAVTTSVGFGFALAGVARTTTGLIVFGLLVALVSRIIRMRAMQNFWLNAKLKPSVGHIIVSPTHAAFDKAAQDLFRRAL